ncbi:MAG: quinone-dependent dihydroorotate dehydrogenase [Ramlibacter sp.]
MSLLPYSLARPFLFSLDPELAHELTMQSLARLQGTPLACTFRNPTVPDAIELAGLRFPNRVGLAAGLDKNARCIDGLGAMGFGFVEVGTVTPRPQPGNAKPRMFRLPQAQALINRLGFNNDGLDAFIANVRRSSLRTRSVQDGAPRLILGLNIGKNAATPIEDATSDYLIGLEGVYPHADYVTVNISSPNTTNLRALQGDEALDGLLGAIAAARRRHGMDGVVATNTTLARDAVQGLPHADQAGGLSGAPVLAASNRVIGQLRTALGPSFPIIGVGGILSADDAVSKIRAGADVVQIYTGLIYRGPQLVAESARAIQRLRQPVA